MSRSDAIERQLTQLEELAKGPVTPDSVKAFRQALSKGACRVAARAARWAAEREQAALCPDMAKAFERFLVNPVKSDPGCVAKMAVVEALEALEAPGEDVFLRGVRHVQKEPAWGPPVDTAANLRGTCAQVLARRMHPLARFEIVTLLTDPEVQARRGAVRALVILGGEASELLLRLKALTGDDSPDVVGLCLSGLMELSPERSMPFIEGFLDSDDLLVAEEAAMALGESRREDAFALLQRRWETWIDPERRGILALPLALLRIEPAFQFLLEAIEHGNPRTAMAVVEALAIHRDDEVRRSRIDAAVDRRGDRSVAQAFRRAFSPGDD